MKNRCAKPEKAKRWQVFSERVNADSVFVTSFDFLLKAQQFVDRQRAAFMQIGRDKAKQWPRFFIIDRETGKEAEFHVRDAF